MPFRDNYTDFTYCDINSEQMKVWVTNGRDLALALTPNFSDSFVSTTAGNGRYHTATSITDTELNAKCIAIDVTLNDWRAIQKWLSPITKGYVSFDFNQNKAYYVKVASKIDGDGFVIGKADNARGDRYNISFTVKFTTINDYAAVGTPKTWYTKDFYSSNDETDNYKDMSDSDNFNYVLDPNYMIPLIWKRNKVDLTLNIGEELTVSPPKLVLLYDESLTFTNSTEIMNLFGSKITESNSYLVPATVGILKSGSEESGILTPVKGSYKLTFGDNALDMRYLSSFSDGNANILVSKNNGIGSLYFGSTSALCEVVHNSSPNITRDGLQYVGNDYYDFNSFCIMNTGSYDMYPSIALKTYAEITVSKNASSEDSSTTTSENTSSEDSSNEKNASGLSKCEVWLNRESHYSYSMIGSNPYYISFDGKTGNTILNNRLADGAFNITNAGVVNTVSSFNNMGPIEIKSGNPELLKIRVYDFVQMPYIETFNEAGETKTRISETIKPNAFILRFNTGEPFKYSHGGRLAAHFFLDFSKTKRTKYNNETYDSIDIKGSFFSVNCIIIEDNLRPNIDNSYALIMSYDYIDDVMKNIINNLGTNNLEGVQAYISLCDYDTIEVQGNNISVSTYTRDVQ